MIRITRPLLPSIILALTMGIGCSRPNLEVLHTLRPISEEAPIATPALPSLALEVMPVRLPETL